jgi:hypothetical protein
VRYDALSPKHKSLRYPLPQAGGAGAADASAIGTGPGRKSFAECCSPQHSGGRAETIGDPYVAPGKEPDVRASHPALFGFVGDEPAKVGGRSNERTISQLDKTRLYLGVRPSSTRGDYPSGEGQAKKTPANRAGAHDPVAPIMATTCRTAISPARKEKSPARGRGASSQDEASRGEPRTRQELIPAGRRGLLGVQTVGWLR